MATSGGFPTGLPGTTAYSKPATVTIAAAIDTLEYYNNTELELVAIDDFGQTVNPAYTVLMGIQTSGAKFDDAKLAEITTDNYPQYKFLEQDSVNRVYTLGANALVGATTLVLGTTVGLQRGDILRNAATNEVVRVASITNATDIVVLRSTGTLDAIAAAAMTSGQSLILMGSSVAIGEAGRTSFSAPAVERYNNIQKIVTSVAINEGDSFTAKYGTNKKVALKRLMDDKWKDQMRSVEYVTVFGQKATSTDAVTGTAEYRAEGILNTALRGWTSDISGALTVKNVIKEFGRTVPYGGGTKLVLCGAEVLAEFYSLFSTQIAVENIKSLDLNVDVLTINGTKFILKEHPLMDSTSGWSKYCVIVDTMSFKPVYPTGSNMNGKNFVGKTRFEYLYDQSNYASEKGDYVSYLTFRNANTRANWVIRVVA